MNQRERREALELTLRPYFERIHAPMFLSAAKPGTLKRNRETLNHWERETANPRLRDTDSETLSAFKSRLFNPESFGVGRRAGRRSPQRLLFDFSEFPPAAAQTAARRTLARATVNIHVRHVLTILNKAGPPGPKNRDALGILAVVPWTKPLRQYKRRPRNVPDDLLEAIYRATSVAEHPRIDGVLPEHWWKAIIVTGVTVGYRKGGMLELPWTSVDWDQSLIRLPAEADKCWEEREKPVSRLVLQHLLRIRTAHELIFHFPASESTFYRQWWAIQAAAGLPENRWIKLHDLKRACGTRWAKIASPWVVQHRLDHSSIKTAQYYINATDEEREAVERLPVPAAFEEDFSPIMALG